ncbi:hypothetical protein GCM10009530_19810 [Microbispora corallina]|uniref:DUF418 domain-containing protein n=1 Tax=Microbispora corallina TaxID=83302 RepID=A0ABQ4FU64_9ACTN|nr:DUF418 domain-containing protein [Microbispora corallina]GIH38359.1 hypothetical protein Mco01_13590 [Microbispora corallina]
MDGPPPPGRIRSLDALRGFAVCGIMLVNTWQHTVQAGGRTSIDWAMDNLAQSRFYPIFSFLFGVGFALFLQSAGRRSDRPRLVLLRRLAVLAVIGLAHRMLDPGEVLLPYAVLGAVLLLPASLLPAPVVLLLAAGATVAALLGGEPYVLIAALFLLGLAVVGYGRAERPAGGGVFAAAAAGAVAFTWWWNHDPPGGGVYQAAALCGAAAYATGLLLLARRAAVLEALGRMALTHYLTSTFVILAAMPLLLADSSGAAVLTVTAATLAAQAVFSRWWLARYRYGPVEWVWRRLTWWGPVPNRHTGSRDTRSALPDPSGPRPEGEPRGGA